ncbi:diguanylate cyclase [Chitinivorax tropicus]|uniref:diguanylate cyclase n=1 Tax=Chitinivorax tropicus TaxID=714531 RepID=A0A840MJK2_9PROT|nr:GGDEF domain-containing protein [Chitinivorax tropicus]MBB5019374.1 diguanylate cyclase [Chitinivorax tropicus]
MSHLLACMVGLILCCLVLAKPAHADLVLRQAQWIVPLADHLMVHPDLPAQINIKQAAHPDVHTQFRPLVDQPSVSGRQWHRFVVFNQSDTQQWLIGLPTKGEIDGYVMRADDLVGHWQYAPPMPFSAANLSRDEAFITVSLPPGQRTTFYLLLDPSKSDVGTLHIRAYETYLEKTRYHSVLAGMLFGGLLVLVLYNLFIFASIRDTSYLYFVSFTGASGLMLLVASGVLTTLTGWESKPWQPILVPALLGLALTGAVNFIRRFLLLDEHQPLLDQLARVVWWSAAALALIALTGEQTVTMSIGFTLTSLTTVLAVLAAVKARLQIAYPARLFLLGWLVFSVAMLTHAMQIIGVFPQWLTQFPALQLGIGLQAILLSFALAHRYKSLSEDHKRNSLEQNTVLEIRVQERTKALDEAMRKLSEANHQLKALNFTDGLTGVRNRKFFDARVVKEWSRARRGTYNLTLAILDIDHFKKINDTYGHQAGDQVLKEVAAAVQSCLKRPCDFLARYGGEEFVVILPLTEGRGAQQLCEVIRKRIADKKITFKQHAIQVTISIGLCTAVPLETQRYETMLRAADDALYRAKRGGRNRVEVGDMANATMIGLPTK